MHLHGPRSHAANSVSSQPDVFVAGGGPAGLASAIAAAQLGLAVEVVDGMAPPIDKACGEGLMPGTLAALAQLGIDLTTAESAPFKGVRFLGTPPSYSSHIAEATFPGIIGRGIRRTILHQLLLNRALELGVRIHWQTVVKSIQLSPRPIVHTNRHAVQPRFVIGADGHQSRVRAYASLERGSTVGAPRIALRQHFVLATDHSVQADFVEVHWSDYGQAYVTPISSREICVAFISSKKIPGVQAALDYFPQLRERLRSASPSGSPRGSVTLSRKLHRVISGNVALVGDASGSVDAVTGEGLNLCFRQALVLAESLRDNNLEHYQQVHRVLRRLPYAMARTMLFLDSSRHLRNCTLAILHHRPQLFDQLLRIHLGLNPLRVFGSTGLIATGAQILVD